MRFSIIFPYVRILIALPFMGGFAFMVGAFIDLSDDYGNLIEQSLLSRFLIFSIGFTMVFTAFIIAVPRLMSRKPITNSVVETSEL